MKALRLVFTATLLVLCAGLALASAEPTWISISGDARPDHSVNPCTLTRNSDEGTEFTCVFAGLESFDVQTQAGTFSRISIPGFTNSTRLGEPALPQTRQIIAVPLGAMVRAEAISFDRREISLADAGVRYPIMPAQRSLFKNERPEDVPFSYNSPTYLQTTFTDAPLVSVEELGILRGLRLFVVIVEPVKYNPSNGTLAVYNNLRVNVEFSGGDLAATRDMRARTWSPYFESAYSQYVLNYRRDRSLDDDLVRYPIKYVIIADPMFTTQLQPFIAWKKMKGFEVIEAYKGDPGVGSTATTIKTYLQGLYNAATPEDPAPSFVLFVGDTAQMPTYWNSSQGHCTDLTYVRLAGTDYLPEIYYGRFSANNTTELQPQIDKTLEYERYEMPDPSYLANVVMIAGVDANYAATYGNGQINYGTTYYFNAAHGITSNTYLYPASGSSDAQIIANASDGRGYMNYTAHGSETSWADPTFTVTNVEALTNAHKYGTVVGNCCVTSAFHVNKCFGEAWLRAANKGAIGYIGATDNSLWDEDFWWGVGAKTATANPTYSATARGAYDGMFHDHGETFPTWYTTQYGFVMAGNLAVVQGGGSNVNYYWEMYSVMGDPSVTTYLGVPTANTVSYPDPVLLGQSSMTVTAEAYSYIGFSMGGELLATGLVPETGSLTLNFEALTSPGTAHVVITRQGRIPVIDSIQVIASSGPYLITSAEQISDAAGDNDGLADFGETLDITLTEENIGTEDATGVNVQITIADGDVTVTDNAEPYGTITSGGTATVNNGFEIALSPNIADGHTIDVDITATDDESHSWTDGFTIMAHAPALSVSAASVGDGAGNGNGVMDAGETVTMTISLTNGGSAGAATLSGILSTDYEYITVTGNTGSMAELNTGETGSLSAYTVAVSPAAPGIDRAFFYLEMTMAGGRTEYLMFEMNIGGFADAMENGQGNWTHSANTGWVDEWHITTRNAHSPTHAWWCGNETTGNYSIHTDARLITPSITLSGHTELRFWHRMDGEVSSYYADSAYDAGIIEISQNGGAWTQLTPTTGGYNKWTRCTAGSSRPYTGPFTCRTPCWSSTIDWTEVVCDLAAYSGPVQIRFRFGSDSSTVRGGWYIDDVQVKLVVGNNPPLNLTAVMNGSDAELSWESPSSGATLATLDGYNVYREGVKIASLVHSLNYQDNMEDMPFGWYHYAVSAQYGAAETGLSNLDSVNWTGAAPDPVTDLTITFVDGTILLNWSAIPSATSYRVYASESYEGAVELVTEVNEPNCTLVGGTSTYLKRFYVVTAVR